LPEVRVCRVAAFSQPREAPGVPVEIGKESLRGPPIRCIVCIPKILNKILSARIRILHFPLSDGLQKNPPGRGLLP